MTRKPTRRREERVAATFQQARLLLALKAGRMGSWDYDLQANRLRWLEGTERLFGLAPDSYSGRFDEFLALIHPDDRSAVAEIAGPGAVERPDGETEFRVITDHGETRWVLARNSVLRDESGTPTHVLCVGMDITEHKQADQLVRESEHRYRQAAERLEQRVKERTEELSRSQSALLQARHLEALGRLAGGVAHDFNNILTGVVGIMQDVKESLERADPRCGDIEEALKASQRAMELTRQLLAFGRKQISAPSPLCLNDVIREMSRMFTRLLGEDIQLHFGLDPQLGLTRIDQTQLEQILINLLMNARDAMPEGGSITLETSNIELGQDYARHHSEVQPGRYVQLTVADSGTGMDGETLERIFEPFFTTKSFGKGSGLGLATVWGVVKQNGGDVAVSSRPGHGTMFRIFLPRVKAEAAGFPGAPAAKPPITELPRGSERILLVEDEELVRRVTARALRRAGYEVVEARNGQEALHRLSGAERVDLLLTDVVMPGMNGRELAEACASRLPSLRVLYMSGHPYEIILKGNRLDPKIAFLQKSFTPDILCRRVREVLDHRPPSVPAA